MLLAYKAAEGYRPVLVVPDIASVTTSPQNTTYVYGIPGEDRGFVNDISGVFLKFTEPLLGQTIEWDQMQANPLDPNQAWALMQMTQEVNQYSALPVFPFNFYKSALLTLINVNIVSFQSLSLRLEFQESGLQFPILRDDPPALGTKFSTYFQ